MARLEGTQVVKLLKTKAGRASLLGKRVKYLCESDIDQSGRGYFFPRVGTVAGFSVRGTEIALDHPMNYVIIRSALREMVVMEQATEDTIA